MEKTSPLKSAWDHCCSFVSGTLAGTSISGTIAGSIYVLNNAGSSYEASKSGVFVLGCGLVGGLIAEFIGKKADKFRFPTALGSSFLAAGAVAAAVAFSTGAFEDKHSQEPSSSEFQVPISIPAAALQNSL